VSAASSRVLAPAPPADVVATRLAALRRRIEDAGRDPEGVRIVAVTKSFEAGAVVAAGAAGLVDIGENYADELLGKAGLLGEAVGRPERVRWHYLGAVQRRRVPKLAPVVACWQTVSRVSEGEALASHAPGAAVLVEVDTTGMPGRNGCEPDAVAGLVATLRGQGLDVRGVMVVGPPGPPEASRASFRVTANLARDLGLPEVSMGMTDDLEVALSEGSTMVRVGRALFGERPLGPA
jgi:PLP dependent protein